MQASPVSRVLGCSKVKISSVKFLSHSILSVNSHYKCQYSSSHGTGGVINLYLCWLYKTAMQSWNDFTIAAAQELDSDCQLPLHPYFTLIWQQKQNNTWMRTTMSWIHRIKRSSVFISEWSHEIKTFHLDTGSWQDIFHEVQGHRRFSYALGSVGEASWSVAVCNFTPKSH